MLYRLFTVFSILKDYSNDIFPSVIEQYHYVVQVGAQKLDKPLPNFQIT